MDFFGIFGGNFLDFFLIFWRNFLGGIFWEDFFLGVFFERNSMLKSLKSAKLFEYERNWGLSHLTIRVTKSVFREHFFSEQTIGSIILSKRSSVWCVLLLTYLPTHSLKSPAFLVPATLDDEGKNANFPSTPPHCRRRHCRPSSRRIIHECSWKPVGHGTHFKPFITSRVPTFLSICLSVCLMW